jgi:DNA polymerase-3 subunit epsilon
VNQITQWFAAKTTREQRRPLRWAVLDLETSGLDPQADRILSIGAVAMHEREVVVADGFEAVVQQATVSDADNIVIHGITGSQQRAGQPLEAVLAAFLHWRGAAPIVGWHVRFDCAFLDRALKARRAEPLAPDSLDVAQLARVMLGRECGDLSDVAARFGIVRTQRHHAAADAWMTAQVLCVLATQAKREGVTGYHGLRSLAAQARWS